MKTILFAAALSAVAISQQTYAQSAPPPPPPTIGPGAAPRPGPGGPPAPGMRPEEGLRTVTTTQGKVAMLTTNDDYVYDGFVMLNGSDSIWVKFPPHMGKQMTSAIKAGSTVSVSGDLNTNPEGKKDLRFISISAGGQTLTDTPPVTPPVPVAETTTSGSGRITAVQTGRMGEVKGFVLNSNTILKVPPHVASQLNDLIKTGATVSYTGNKKAAADGEVSTGNYTVVHTQTITVNGQQYITR